jgi:hypothetical protein
LVEERVVNDTDDGLAADREADGSAAEGVAVNLHVSTVSLGVLGVRLTKLVVPSMGLVESVNEG